jgi:murein DD-endopeptidase MepM/ murein hydrolase activator NlpD
VTNSFSSSTRHWGVDIVAKPNEAIKATLDGVVIFSDWTLETGYTIGIQHQQNLISVYKHNASLLKKTGAYVRAGEPIAIIGSSGELSTGPHLHFELWYNGSPVNPKDYMAF